MTDSDWDTLAAAWAPAREAGVVGPVDIDDVVAHAAGYVPAAWRVQASFRGVDLGTGAGIPGIPLALLHPQSQWLLIDASARRVDLARLAVEALDLGARVELRHVRAEELSHEPTWRARVDLVVARRFGDLAEALECGGPLVRAGGRLVVSTTDEAVARLEDRDLGRIGLASIETWETTAGRYVALTGTGTANDRFPRRPPARRHSPIC